MPENTYLEAEENKQPSTSIKDEIFDWVQNITFILSAIVLIFIFLFRIVGVDGESMMPTLHDKDWLITSDFLYEPENGDIVVLAKESFLDGKMIVKGLKAGQTEASVTGSRTDKFVITVREGANGNGWL